MFMVASSGVYTSFFQAQAWDYTAAHLVTQHTRESVFPAPRLLLFLQGLGFTSSLVLMVTFVLLHACSINVEHTANADACRIACTEDADDVILL